MIKDAFLMLTPDAGQALTAAAASANTLDLCQVKPTPGMNRILSVVFQVMEDVTGTLSFSIAHCDSASGTFKDVVISETLTAPEAGTQVALPIPEKTLQFIQAKFGAAPTKGKVRAFVSMSHDNWFAAKEAPSKQIE